MFGRKQANDGHRSDALTAAATHIADVALRSVQTADGGVRVEDYLTVLAAAAGESVLVSAGLFDIEHNELTPGSAVFGDRINAILTGDSISLAEMTTDTVVGLYRAELVPVPIAPDALPDPRRLYEHVAGTVNDAPWGYVATTVDADHQPRVMALRAAFEMRAAVDEAVRVAEVNQAQRWVPCVLAICAAMRQVQAAIDMRLASTLVMEVLFAMSKTVPMSSDKLA
jgi:hypothetical protein